MDADAQRMQGRAYVQTRCLILSIALLSACRDDVRGIALADVDTSDVAAMRDLGKELPEKERNALITYAAIHAPSSSRFCGRNLAYGDGQAPKTIGEAIELTLQREAQFRMAGLEARKLKTSYELAEERWESVITRRELVIHRQGMLLAEHGAAARQRAEWRVLEARQARYDLELSALRKGA